MIRNLSDPKLHVASNPTHHKIPWDCQDDSVGSILQSCPFVRKYLTERIGYAPLVKGGRKILCLFDSDDEEERILERAKLEVNYALARLEDEQAGQTTPTKNETEGSSEGERCPSVGASNDIELKDAGVEEIGRASCRERVCASV